MVMVIVSVHIWLFENVVKSCNNLCKVDANSSKHLKPIFNCIYCDLITTRFSFNGLSIRLFHTNLYKPLKSKVFTLSVHNSGTRKYFAAQTFLLHLLRPTNLRCPLLLHPHLIPYHQHNLRVLPQFQFNQ